MAHVIDPKACTLCGACEAECPHGAIAPDGRDMGYVVDGETCTDCGDCVEVCPAEAIGPTAS